MLVQENDSPKEVFFTYAGDGRFYAFAAAESLTCFVADNNTDFACTGVGFPCH